MGQPRLPGYMFVLSFFPACIVSVSPRGTFAKHEKRIQMDDLVCSLDMCCPSIVCLNKLIGYMQKIISKAVRKVGRLEF